MTSKSFTEAWLDGHDGHHFYTRTYPAVSPQKAVLIFIHGFGDHISRYGDIHPRFAAHGITVFAYDIRGFGRTALDKENRSPDELYGKTNRPTELEDLDWWVNHVAKTYPDVPIFVMGYSAVTTVAVNALSKISPYLQVPATIPINRFSHDPKVKKALLNDPLRMGKGTVRGIYDILSQGEELLQTGYKRWPNDLPIIITWGTADEVNCPKAGAAFLNKLQIKDKKLVEFHGALHDLLHEAGNIPDQVIREYITFIEAHLQERLAA